MFSVGFPYIIYIRKTLSKDQTVDKSTKVSRIFDLEPYIDDKIMQTDMTAVCIFI